MKHKKISIGFLWAESTQVINFTPLKKTEGLRLRKAAIKGRET
jgi:hypothetical protein